MIEILRPKDAAARLGIAVSTLYRWEKRPGFPTRIKLGPRTSGWNAGDLEAWLEKQAKQHEEAAA